MGGGGGRCRGFGGGVWSLGGMGRVGSGGWAVRRSFVPGGLAGRQEICIDRIMEERELGIYLVRSCPVLSAFTPLSTCPSTNMNFQGRPTSGHHDDDEDDDDEDDHHHFSSTDIPSANPNSKLSEVAKKERYG